MTTAAAPGLFDALLAVQAEAPTLPKDAVNPHYRSKYTPLDTIVEKIGPILNKHGLVWMTFPCHDEHGNPALRYSLTHAATGEALRDMMPLLLSKQDAQGMGSAITYARRYSLCAVLNLVADDDDDGNNAARGTTDSRTTSADPGAALPGAPTGPQLKYLKTLVTQSHAPERTIRAMLDQVGATNVQIEAGWAGKLTRDQASSLIELFKNGVLPDPEAIDIPTDEIAVNTVGDGSDLPFET
jgi:ERF superfamily protein